MSSVFTKIILPTRPQPDTIVAIFLLRVFGAQKYPGIDKAVIEILSDLPKGETPESLEQKGVLLIDLGGGKFDHHNKNTTASQLIANDLGIGENPALAKLLKYAERDDKYGMGTISQDALDRAFGLSGLIASLNKVLQQEPAKVVDYALPLIKAHYLEERKRTEDLPNEFKEKLQSGKAELFTARHKGKNIKVAVIESDNASINGWLRSKEGVKDDLVIQKSSAGYVNITTRQMKRIDLRWTVGLLRQGEIDAQGRKVNLPLFAFLRPGRLPEAPEWYYDRATNSILNGGIIQKGVGPTRLSLALIKELVKEGLAVEVQRKRSTVLEPPSGTSAYFLEIRVPQEAAKEIRVSLESPPAGIKMHLPENYHITLMYLGDYAREEIAQLIEALRSVLSEIKNFNITISSEDFKSGIVPGYPNKSFYFEIKDQDALELLHDIHARLEKVIPRAHEQEFYPHISVATAMPNVDERVIADAAMLMPKAQKFEFTVTKIRLTEVFKNTEGQMSYRKRQEFVLNQ